MILTIDTLFTSLKIGLSIGVLEFLIDQIVSFII